MTTRGQDVGGWTLNRLVIALGWLAYLVHEVLLVARDPAGAQWAFIVMFLLPGTVALAAAFRWRRPWLDLTAAILIAIPSLLSFAFFDLVPALADPLRGADHTDALLGVLSIGLAVPGGVLAFVQGRRGVEAHAGNVVRSPRGAVTLAFTALLVGAMLVGVQASTGSRSALGAGYDFDVSAQQTVVIDEFAFSPGIVPLVLGEMTEIVVKNRDPTFHTLTYENSGRTYSHDLASNAEARFLVKFDTAGTIQFWCEPHATSDGAGHQGMVGEFVVG